MSVEAITLALHHSRASGTAKLVLLGIANHEGDGGAWPSVATLARYANVDVRSVQRAISRLVELGEVIVKVQAGGKNVEPDYRRPNLYELRLFCPVDCDRSRNHRTKRTASTAPLPLRVTSASPGDVSVTPPGDASVTPPGDASVTQTSPTEPPTERDAVGLLTTDRARDLVERTERARTDALAAIRSTLAKPKGQR